MSAFKDQLGDTVLEYPEAPGFQRTSETSRAAAQSMRPHFTAQQRRIVDFLKNQGERGGTYNEIISGTGIASPSVCARMVELVNGNHVVKTGTRATPSGRKATVYRAVLT